MEQLEIVAYALAAVLIISVFVARERRLRERERAAVAELKEKLFPQLLENLKALDKRLSEEEVGGEGYVELLGRGWRSTLILDFHRYYIREEEIFTSLRQDLKEYEEEGREWKKTRDEKLRERMGKRRTWIRGGLTELTERLEKLM